ncbi:MAG TPA: DUF2059 domain-containing protein [Candidatus Acidoferrum sp.]|nr:DUF2059 domain-containing protein [Candidatus Acidoferrum sp.]
MNFRFTAIAAGLFLAGSAMAQIAPQPPARVQPGVPASSAAAQPADNPAAAPAPVKVDPAKEKAIRQLMELMDVTGTGKLGNNMTEVVSEQVKNAMSRRLPPDRLQKFMVDFNQKLTAKSPASQVEDAQVPIYAQHFSLEELQGMIQFYQSPVGQQMVKQLPDVLQQSQMQGAVIERKAALDTLKDMSNDYPELKSMLGPPEENPQGSQPPGSLKPKQPQPQSQQQPQSQR